MTGTQPDSPDDLLQQLTRGVDPLFLKLYELTKPRGISDVSEGVQHLYQTIQDAASLTREVRGMREDMQESTRTLREATATMQESTRTLKTLIEKFS